MALFPHREAMHLQCFTPTRYVKGMASAHMKLTTITNFCQNCCTDACLHYMALLCIQLKYVVVFGQFFFCLVCRLPCKKKS